MDVSLATALGLGLLLGLRHALDADHVAAVSTLVARERGLARSCLLGAFWGAGHTLALLGAGIAVIAFKLTITPGLEEALERMVGAVLVLLGGHVLLRAAGGLLADGREHTHDGIAHRHPQLRLGPPEAGHVHLLRLGGRPFLVGLLHGLAGSAALTLLVLGADPVSDRRARLHPGVRHRLDGGNAAAERARRAPGGAGHGRGAPGRDGGPGPRRGRKRGPGDLDARGAFRLRALPRPAAARAQSGPGGPSVERGRKHTP